ncbi:MAG: DUF3810 domain-containing protein [Ferruginibacter sp.]
MKLQKKAGIAAILFIFGLSVHLYSNSKIRVETGYSIQFFPQFSRFLRTVFGKLPFSFGDILYGLLVCWLIWKIARFFKFAFRKQPGISKKPLFANAFLDLFIFCTCIYIVFNVFWGINYNRKGIAWQLELKMEKYSTEDLKQVNAVLVDHINASKKLLVDNNTSYPSNRELFIMVADAYKQVSVKYPFLIYRPLSIKSSMWGWLGNYTGFTGYYNPFTAEAQLNTTVPKFLQPFVACHEVAHQLGYAKEMEANFVGYLAASNSGNSLFKYSVYLDLFIYANRNLFFTDSVAAKLYSKALSGDVVLDLKEWKEFNRKHQSIAEPLVRWVYGKYLQGNQQPSGVLSYDEVTAFIIAYYKKYGRI